MRRRSPSRSARSRFAQAGWRLACGIALGSIALACGNNEPASPEPGAPPAETAPAAPEPGAPAAALPAQPEAAPEDPVFSEGVIPEGFPSDVPTYPGATPGSSVTMPGGVFATFESADAVDAIVSRYRDELTKGGWSVQDDRDGDGVDATKGSRSVQVRVRPNEEGKTEIAVDVSQS